MNIFFGLYQDLSLFRKIKQLIFEIIPLKFPLLANFGYHLNNILLSVFSFIVKFFAYLSMFVFVLQEIDLKQVNQQLNFQAFQDCVDVIQSEKFSKNASILN